MAVFSDRALAFYAKGAVAVANGLAWAQTIVTRDLTVGGVVSAITLGGGAIVGVVVLAIRQIGAAYTDTKRQADEANKSSLSGQLAEANTNLEHVRASLHDLRNQLQAERLRHAEETERWAGELKLLHDTNVRLNGEIARLTGATHEVRSVTKEIKAATQEVRANLGHSGDSIPTQGSGGGPPP